MSRAPAAAVLAAALLSGGCAALAVPTPTPAARISEQELARLPPPPNERYYLLVFGSERRPPKQAKYTHTWAALVRAVDTPGCGGPAIEVHPISWLPSKMDIEPLRFEVEPGTNFDLPTTLRHVLGTGQTVAMWGPYQVWHGFAHRFLVQKQFLESGRVGYQCIDNVGEAARTGNGCDCIHAITDMDPVYSRERYPLAFYGKTASANLIRRLMHSPIFIDPPRTHDWLIPRLGLDQYPITRREYRGRSAPHVPGGPAGLEYAVRPVIPIPRPGGDPLPIPPAEPGIPGTAPVARPATPAPPAEKGP